MVWWWSSSTPAEETKKEANNNNNSAAADIRVDEKKSAPEMPSLLLPNGSFQLQINEDYTSQREPEPILDSPVNNNLFNIRYNYVKDNTPEEIPSTPGNTLNENNAALKQFMDIGDELADIHNIFDSYIDQKNEKTGDVSELEKAFKEMIKQIESHQAEIPSWNSSEENRDKENLINSIHDNYDPENNAGFPIKNKSIDRYKIENEKLDKNAIDRCSHPVMRATKEKKTKPGEYKHYFFKLTTNALMAVLESAANAFYRRLVPGVVSSTSAIYGNNTHVGVMSKAIDEFKSFRDDFYDGVITNEQIKTLAKILMSSYLFEEDDLHRGNIGKKGRIDYDMSFWTILRLIKGDRPTDKYIPALSSYVGRNPEIAFRITEKDIRNFPDVEDNLSYYWPTKTGVAENNFSSVENKFIRALKNHPVFIREKFKIALKFLLVFDKTSSKATCDLHIKEKTKIAGQKAADRFVSKISSRQAELKKILTNMPEFFDFMVSDGQDVLKEIIQETSKENERIERKIARGKKEYEPLILDVEQLTKDYGAIKEELMKNRQKDEAEQRAQHKTALHFLLHIHKNKSKTFSDLSTKKDTETDEQQMSELLKEIKLSLDRLPSFEKFMMSDDSRIMLTEIIDENKIDNLDQLNKSYEAIREEIKNISLDDFEIINITDDCNEKPDMRTQSCTF